MTAPAVSFLERPMAEEFTRTADRDTVAPVVSNGTQDEHSADRVRRTRPWWLSRRWRLAAKAVIMAVVLYLTWRFSRRVGWDQVADRLLASDPRWVALGVALLLARFASLQHRWHLALARLGSLPGQIVQFFVLLSAIFVNHVTPTARVLGGVFRARYLVRPKGPSFAALYGTVLVDVVSSQAVLILMTWLAIVLLAWHENRVGLAWLAGVLLFVVVGAAALWLRRREADERGERLSDRLRHWLSSRETKHEAFVEGSQETVGLLFDLLSDRRLQSRMAGWGAAAFLVNAAAQWVLFLAIGARVDPTVVVVTVALGAGAGVLAGVPGGVGATEAAMIAGFVALGVNETDATAATLLYRGLHYAVILVTGLPALVWFELVTGLRERDRSA